MPTSFTFDTNYLRKLGISDFLEGRMPARLQTHVQRAFARGDLVFLTNTVRLEMNAWLEKTRLSRQGELRKAIELLTDAGHAVTPGVIQEGPAVDLRDVFVAGDSRIALLEPSLMDYSEAERRATYRIPPLPKSPDGEELRDRIIWCQLVRYARESGNTVLLMSDDEIFHNGAASEEGMQSRIKVLRQESELDQRLGDQPEAVAKAVGALLQFADELRANGRLIEPEMISSLDELRKMLNPDGSTLTAFKLVLLDGNHPLNGARVALTVKDDQPLSLAIDGQHFRKTDAAAPQWASRLEVACQEHEAAELRHLIQQGRL